jgi:hypothetical protein
MKKVIILVVIMAFCATLAQAAEEKADAAKKAPAATKAVTTAPAAKAAAAKTPAAAPGKALRRPAFTVVFGTLTKVDYADPAKPKIEVKGDLDGKTRNIQVTPWTSVTKVTDLSELKGGDSVRVMTRKVDDNEVAMTVVFGKIRNIPATRAGAGLPAAPAQAAPPAKGK